MSFQLHLNKAWMGAWLDAVATGDSAMSHRALASVERHGGLPAAVEAARARNLHLVELSDDRGVRQVAASAAPITTLC